MAEDRNILQVTKDLRGECVCAVRVSGRHPLSLAGLPVVADMHLLPTAAVCAILQDYGDGLGPVTDTSAELHRLCGCLERLLQVGPWGASGQTEGHWQPLGALHCPLPP